MRLAIRRRSFLAALAGTVAVAPGRPPAARAAAPFDFQAAWATNAEFMGYLIALDRSWYAAEGLDLIYHPGGPDVVPEDALLSGGADLALTMPDTTIKAIVEQGAPLRIVGAQYQKNPIGVVSLGEGPIREPGDLVGKTLAVPPAIAAPVAAVLRLNGVDEGDVRIVPYAYDPTPLIEGEVDAAAVDFTPNALYAIEQAGKEAASFLLYDFGFPTYGDIVVVAEATLRARRGEIVAFLRASRRGWAENFKDPTLWPPRFADTWFKDNGRTIANEVYLNEAQEPLIEHPGGVFAMTEEDIAGNIEALARIGIRAGREMFDATLLAEL